MSDNSDHCIKVAKRKRDDNNNNNNLGLSDDSHLQQIKVHAPRSPINYTLPDCIWTEHILPYLTLAQIIGKMALLSRHFRHLCHALSVWRHHFESFQFEVPSSIWIPMSMRNRVVLLRRCASTVIIQQYFNESMSSLDNAFIQVEEMVFDPLGRTILKMHDMYYDRPREYTRHEITYIDLFKRVVHFNQIRINSSHREESHSFTDSTYADHVFQDFYLGDEENDPEEVQSILEFELKHFIYFDKAIDDPNDQTKFADGFRLLLNVTNFESKFQHSHCEKAANLWSLLSDEKLHALTLKSYLERLYRELVHASESYKKDDVSNCVHAAFDHARFKLSHHISCVYNKIFGGGNFEYFGGL